MSEEQKFGPTKTTRPQETYNSCFGCGYYDRKMVRSGREPIYSSHCNNPSIPEYLKSFKGAMHGNLNDSSKTPDWCPFLNNKNE